MARTLRVMGVHGVGNHHTDLSWQSGWEEAIRSGLTRWNPDLHLEFYFPLYDDAFAADKITPAAIAIAVAKLLGSGIFYGIGDLFRRRRGLASLPERVRWTAGMVVQWAENDKLREQLRRRIRAEIARFQPEIIVAHSLGSLVSYDTFIHEPEQSQIAGRIFITFGSQIGNPFVRGIFGGRLVPVAAQRWYHLFNPEDDVLTAPIRLNDPRFEQLDTYFDIAGIADHAAEYYLGHDNTVATVYRQLAAPVQSLRAFRFADRAFAQLASKPRRRALLVGINNYPQETDRLEGCVNDVFLMSAVLQDLGFAAEQIRVVLDERATAAGIRERLEWLLEGAQAGDQRVLFYSGHGAQISGYGVKEEVDRVDECLVPYDFDWTTERAILDDELFELYSQLPYGAQFVMILDCCHSGGMARGARKIRGLSPPDDIRHRELRWNSAHEMWSERKLVSPNRSLQSRREGRDYLGASGVKRRLGRAITLRSLPNRKYDAVRSRLGHFGPYLPMIFQACRESEFAEEYRHGVTAYGAFTYALHSVLRQQRRKRGRLTFKQLVEATTRRLHDLGYTQSPQLLGPGKLVEQPIPW